MEDCSQAPPWLPWTELLAKLLIHAQGESQWDELMLWCIDQAIKEGAPQEEIAAVLTQQKPPQSL
jgi:hypothetical protein